MSVESTYKFFFFTKQNYLLTCQIDKLFKRNSFEITNSFIRIRAPSTHMLNFDSRMTETNNYTIMDSDVWKREEKRVNAI